MRLTGLITLRGGGRFIDLNHNEQAKIDYVLGKYSSYAKYSNEEDYFNYISAFDSNLITAQSKVIAKATKISFLQKWADHYCWDNIKSEMLKLQSKALSQDPILKYLSHPVRLEFLTALAVKVKFPDIKVIPNYPIDDEGLPTSTAAGIGNTGDIECYEDDNGVLIEVTMSEGRTQTVMEIWPISRHLAEFDKKVDNSMCYFVAPSIFIDSQKQIAYVKQQDNLLIIAKTIQDFVSHLEDNNSLFNHSP